ncbi:MAG: DUF2288 domain-containing protein [Alkalinema sp. RU_4_3]|nr:DUF2288 domain-containing protein [Alkalinema sp. RU_4_3]
MSEPIRDLRSELEKNIDAATWEWLIPHDERDVIIWVDQSIDLLEVGMAIAQDQTQAVQHWIAEQVIAKPSEAQKQRWSAMDANFQFSALIVQPYVLIQERAASS